MYESGSALGHKSRKLVYNFISSNPGASLGAIKKFFDLNESTLKYHIHYLEKNNKIYSSHDGKHRCYFCKQRNVSDIYPEKTTRTAISNLTKTQKHIVNVIKTQPGVTQKEIIKITKLNKKTVSYNMKRLGDLKVVWVVKRDGREGYEYITKDKLRNEMLNELITKLISDEIDEKTFRKIKRKLENMDFDEYMK